MSRIEAEFLTLALEIGLAETIAETLRDIDRSMAELPTNRPLNHLSTRYRYRLEDHRAGLRQPTLRTTAALVVSMCNRRPELTPRIRRAFSRLAERHPELAWFYAQLPAGEAQVEPLRRFG